MGGLSSLIALIGARGTGLIFSLSGPSPAVLGFNRRSTSDCGAMPNSSVHVEVRLSAAGVQLAVLAAFGEAAGILTMRPVMLNHPDPFCRNGTLGLWWPLPFFGHITSRPGE
jgi:hypothetical protein